MDILVPYFNEEKQPGRIVKDIELENHEQVNNHFYK